MNGVINQLQSTNLESHSSEHEQPTNNQMGQPLTTLQQAYQIMEQRACDKSDAIIKGKPLPNVNTEVPINPQYYRGCPQPTYPTVFKHNASHLFESRVYDNPSCSMIAADQYQVFSTQSNGVSNTAAVTPFNSKITFSDNCKREVQNPHEQDIHSTSIHNTSAYQYHTTLQVPNPLANVVAVPPRIFTINLTGQGCTNINEFLQDRLENPNLKSMDVYQLFRDQHGSRYIQEKLGIATPIEKQIVFNEIREQAHQLMEDEYGSIVIHKFFEIGSQEQKLELVRLIHDRVSAFAQHRFASQVMQKALEYLERKEQIVILEALKQYWLTCVTHVYGHHVIRKCIQCMPAYYTEFIADGCKAQICKLACHQFGSYVIQSVLEHFPETCKTTILDEICWHTHELVTDNFGKFTINSALIHGNTNTRDNIVSKLLKKFSSYIYNSNACYVIGECLNGSTTNRFRIIEQVFGFNFMQFQNMMADKPANRVLQKLLDVADLKHQKMLCHKIGQFEKRLSKLTKQEHVQTLLMKRNELLQANKIKTQHRREISA